MVQTTRIAWQEDNLSYVEDMVLRLVFVENTKASTLLQALQCALEELNIEGLFKLSLKIDILILHITSDMASCNLRVR